MKKFLCLLLALALLPALLTACAAPGAASGSSSPAPVSITPAEASTAVTDTAPADSYPLVDAHLHYLDFLQRTDGFAPLVEKMDACGVTHAVIFGMAMAKQWDENAPSQPSYYLSNDSRCYYYSATDYILMEDYMAQPKEIRDRFFPFIGGINPNDRYAADHLRRLLEMYPGEIYGIGELMSRHDDLTALTYGEPPHADHPALLAVYDLAAEYDIPVLIHHNIGPSYTDDPLYLEEMKNALAHNRNTTIIWAHTGISRRVVSTKHTQIIDQMLRENPNLYYDISWVVFDDMIAANTDSLAEWAALITKYPDRFMIGSDKVGHWAEYTGEITKYYPLLDLLSPEVRDQLARTNILRLIHVDPASLEEELQAAA